MVATFPEIPGSNLLGIFFLKQPAFAKPQKRKMHLKIFTIELDRIKLKSKPIEVIIKLTFNRIKESIIYEFANDKSIQMDLYFDNPAITLAVERLKEITARVR